MSLDLHSLEEDLELAHHAMTFGNHLHMIIICYDVLEKMLLDILAKRSLPPPVMGNDLHYLLDSALLFDECGNSQRQVMILLSRYREDINEPVSSRMLRRKLNRQQCGELYVNVRDTFDWLKKIISDS